MTDLDDLIERLRAATEGVTPGPWTLRRDAYDVLLMQAGDDAIMGNRIHEEWTPPETDWPFIAAARQLVPEAAAALEALRDEVARKVEAAYREGLDKGIWDGFGGPENPEEATKAWMASKARAALKHQ